MTIEQMKQLSTGDVLLDSTYSRPRRTVLCMMVEVQNDGLLVMGYDKSSRPFYYNDLNDKLEELIT